MNLKFLSTFAGIILMGVLFEKNGTHILNSFNRSRIHSLVHRRTTNSNQLWNRHGEHTNPHLCCYQLPPKDQGNNHKKVIKSLYIWSINKVKRDLIALVLVLKEKKKRQFNKKSLHFLFYFMCIAWYPKKKNEHIYFFQQLACVTSLCLDICLL